MPVKFDNESNFPEAQAALFNKSGEFKLPANDEFGVTNKSLDLNLETDLMVSIYKKSSNDIWENLLDRQIKAISGYACQEFFDGFKTLSSLMETIPDLATLSARLYKLTGPGFLTREKKTSGLAKVRIN